MDSLIESSSSVLVNNSKIEIEKTILDESVCKPFTTCRFTTWRIWTSPKIS